MVESRQYDLGLAALAVLSLIVYITTTAYDAQSVWITVFDYSVWAVFALDYASRIMRVNRGDRWNWIKSHPMDALTVALPMARVLRVIALISRLTVVAQRGTAERLLATTASGVSVVVLAAAAGVLNAERAADGANITTYNDAIWWAITTVTTVGYGDRFPVTGEGRVIASLLMVIGIGMIGTVIAAVGSYMIPNRESAQVE